MARLPGFTVSDSNIHIGRGRSGFSYCGADGQSLDVTLITKPAAREHDYKNVCAACVRLATQKRTFANRLIVTEPVTYEIEVEGKKLN